MKHDSALEEHFAALRACTRCPRMLKPVVYGRPVASRVLLVGQAPGDKEGPAGKPFAWTAGKTMFQWFSSIGLTEEQFRSRVYMAADRYPFDQPDQERVTIRVHAEQVSAPRIPLDDDPPTAPD